jgi:hypothetical protein
VFSTLLELAGFAAIIAATYLLAGLAASLFVAGGCLLLTGYATEDEKAVLALRRATRPVRAVAQRARERRAQRRHRRAARTA